jgi:secreted trypsin-like serine protease
MGFTYVLLAALSICFTSSVQGAEDTPDLSIINGDDADENKYPFMVRLLKLGKHICGASLISSKTVLTAAHCVELPGNEADHPVKFKVVVGDHDKSTTGTHEQELDISQIILHEQFNVDSNLNDIALLVLKEEVKLKKGVIETISLAWNDTLYAEGINATVIGWGRNEDGNIAETLQELEYRIASRKTCPRAPKSQICAKDPEFDSFVSGGDSGGPLITKSAGKFIQIGLLSWGRKLDDGLNLNGFSNVHYFLPWIEETMARAEADVSQWIEITQVIPRIEKVEGSQYVKGKLRCVVERRKYGEDLSMKKDVMVFLVTYRNNVTKKQRVLGRMKYKKRSGVHMYIGTFGSSAKVPEGNCFACVAEIPGTELKTYSDYCL